MNNEIFVRNVEIRCKQKGVPPTVACRESGAGKDFLTNLKKGQSPSLGKAQQLAQYLGCTVSDLLGETGTATQVLDMLRRKNKNKKSARFGHGGGAHELSHIPICGDCD